jgi:hypothetical protein
MSQVYYTGKSVNEVIVQTESPAFERLHALVRKGYSPSLGTDTGDGSIVLRHLGRAPDLVLRADGTIAEHDARRPRHKSRLPDLAPIPANRDADHLQFMKFLETVPKATLRDRTRPWRRKYIYIPIALLIFWGLSLMFSVMLFGG